MVEEYDWGCCPECGPAHWCYCPTHRFAWKIGYDLFSSWQEETQHTWVRHSVLLATCTVIDVNQAQYSPEQRRADATAAELLDWL
jgi:hypothetical protein